MKSKRQNIFETNSSSAHAITLKDRPDTDYFDIGGHIRRKKIRLDFDTIDWGEQWTFFEKLNYLTVLRLAEKFGCWDAKLRPGDVENDPDMCEWEEEVCTRLRDKGIDVDGFDYSECYYYGDSKYDDDTDEDTDKPDVDKDTPPGTKGELQYDIDHQVVEDGKDTCGNMVVELRMSTPYFSSDKTPKMIRCWCHNTEHPKDIDILFNSGIAIEYGWDSYETPDDDAPASLNA